MDIYTARAAEITETYSKNELSEVFENGLCLNDFLNINPAMGSKRKVKLNRTYLEIHLKSKYLAEYSSHKVILPALGVSDQSFKLELWFSNKEKQDHDGRYLISSLSGAPFRHNGVITFKAFLQRGDSIDLGYNKLKCCHIKQFTLSESKLDLLNETKVLKSTLPILIEGETGTGKSSLALELHKKSGRHGAFVQLNLSSFSVNLIESELFGHVKGAFTGASCDKQGAVLEANRGTLFLDEIDSLPIEIQTKLLLFLDSKEFRPVGGSFKKTADVRFIFAAGRYLEKVVLLGEMRKDFYYRLSSGVKVRLKSLRESTELIDKFCERFAKEHSCYMESEALNFYKKIKWHGNYRQLKGHLEKKLMHVHNNRISLDKLDEDLLKTPTILVDQDEVLSLDSIKRNYAKKVFQRFDQNFSRTAEALRITTTTCRKLVKSLD